MNDSSLRFRILIRTAAVSLFFIAPCYAGEWLNAVVKSSGGALHRQADSSSEKLGKYPAGQALKVYSPDQNGFYGVYFNPIFKNARYGWISVDDVDVTSHGGKKSGSSKFKTNNLNLGMNYYHFSPTDMQLALGAKASSTIAAFGFTGEYERNFSSTISVSLQIGNYSISQTATNPFSASGISVIPSIGYHVFQARSIRVTLMGGLGVTMSTVGNLIAGSTTSISTSGILSYPILLQVRGQYMVSNSFHLILRAGYQMLSISQAPYLIDPTNLTTPTENLSLTSLFGGLGLGYSF